MSLAVPLYGFGASGGTGGTLTVTAPANVTVTISKDGKTKTKNSGTSGVVVFKGLASGTWTVTITSDGKTAQKNIVVTTDYSTAISFSTIPEFTYTGDYEIVNDSDEPITVSQGNWKIRFLTSGTLTFTNLNGAEGGIDVFLVGGGGNSGTGGELTDGGSGGGAYNVKNYNVQVNTNTTYPITVGAGSGKTSAFGYTAKAGETGKSNLGDINEYKPVDRTTYEFNATTGNKYGQAGRTGSGNAAANTGNGGGGIKNANGKHSTGGSGIVIVRNARGAA